MVLLVSNILPYNSFATIVAGGTVYYRNTIGGGANGYNYTNTTIANAYGSFGDVTVELTVVTISCINPGYEFCPRMGVVKLSNPNPPIDIIASENLEDYALSRISIGENTGIHNTNFMDNDGNKVSYKVFWYKNEDEEVINVSRNGVE